MDSDSKFPVIAKVDLGKVSLIKETRQGIDFFNEIDIWAKMEFRSREQIRKLQQNKNLERGSMKSLSSLHYSVRERLD